MADFIKVIPEQLRERAGSVRVCRAQHDDIIRRLNNLVLTLGDNWNSEAQAAFLTKYQGMQKDFRQFSEMLESFAEEMDVFSSKMQEADQVLAAKIRELR